MSQHIGGYCTRSWTGDDPCRGSWSGIGCNAALGVASISLQYCQTSYIRNINLSLPLKNITRLVLSSIYLSGPIDLGNLPPTLTYLDLSNNRLNGTVSLGHLVASLQYLDLSNNQFTGPLALDSLPPSLQSLQLDHNRFSGSVVLDRLPASLTSLRLEDNDLSWISFGASLLSQNPFWSTYWISIENNPWACPLVLPTWLTSPGCGAGFCFSFLAAVFVLLLRSNAKRY